MATDIGTSVTTKLAFFIACVIPVITWKVDEVGIIQHWCFMSGCPGTGAESSSGVADPHLSSSQAQMQVPLRQPSLQ